MAKVNPENLHKKKADNVAQHRTAIPENNNLNNSSINDKRLFDDGNQSRQQPHSSKSNFNSPIRNNMEMAHQNNQPITSKTDKHANSSSSKQNLQSKCTIFTILNEVIAYKY